MFRTKITALVILAFSAFVALAQAPLSGEGSGGEVDKNHKGPVVTVRPIVETGNVKILADAYFPNKQFEKFPLRFDFFVNRKLFSSQFRSPELPGPVGVDVPSSVATLPFNYSVVATILHPNHLYTTVIQSAVFESSAVATLDCTLTINASSETDIGTYSHDAVEITKTNDGSYTLGFTGTDESLDSTAKVSGTFSGSATSISGTVNFNVDGEARSALISGTITSSGSNIIEIALSSDDNETSLDCS